ncbi:ATP-binding protein [bacterium]|nr:ATP-binding protein [bacterium]
MKIINDFQTNKLEIRLDGTLDNLESLREEITNFIKHKQDDISDEWIKDLRLIATEIFVNICKHSRLKANDLVNIRIEYLKTKVRMCFFDNGIPWKPGEIQGPDKAIQSDNGYGLYIIKALSKRFRYIARGKGRKRNITFFEKNF